MKRLRVAIVGAGVVGLAYAWSAARRGHQVTVFERDPRAAGASVRNFGMIWPIGQPPGELYRIALDSRRRWLELSKSAGVWVNRCGALHLAYRPDELAVLQEFAAAAADLGVACRLISAREVIDRSAGANPQGLLGGLLSTTELCVNPRRAIAQTAAWLAEHLDVAFQFSTWVSGVQPGELLTACGRHQRFDQIIVCSGVDARALFPAAVQASQLRLCKLQMLCTDEQPQRWRLGPHLAGGLTLRHYANFAICPSLPALKQRIAEETPELDRYGIHVMASQNERGQVILGDSHEYDESIEPFDKEIIDRLMLSQLQRILRLPRWSIAQRWHGVYAKAAEGPLLRAEPQPGVHLRSGTGGAGMTMAFGLAEADWDAWSQ